MKSRSLRFRLAALFSALVLAGALVTLMVTSLTTRAQFDRYVNAADRRRALALSGALASYYAANGGWDGVDRLLARPGAAAMPPGMNDAGSMGDMGSMMMGGPGRFAPSPPRPDASAAAGRRYQRGTPYMLPLAPIERIAVAAPDGTTIVDTAGPGAPAISAQDFAHGDPIVSDGKTVGRLLVGSMINQSLDPYQRQFIQSVRLGVILSSVTVALLAAILGNLFLGSIVRPLKQLTAAADHIAASQGAVHRDLPPSGAGDEIRRLSQSFERMQISIRQEEEARKRLFRDVAHDLRTPVALLKGELEAMLDGIYETNPKRIRSLLSETDTLARLIQDIQMLAALDAQELNLNRESVDPNELVEDAVRSFRTTAQSMGVSLIAEEAANPPMVSVDRARVMQVIGNLVENAFSHGSPLHAVTVRLTTPETNSVRISVIDDGRGIPEEQLEHVFERLFRGNATRQSGSGLGLSIAKRIVEAHGGQITVESDPGRRTEFVVELPADAV